MTSIDEIVRELTALLEKATPGPWTWDTGAYAFQDPIVRGPQYEYVLRVNNLNNWRDTRDLIIAARNHLPALLSTLARREEALRDCDAALQEQFALQGPFSRGASELPSHVLLAWHALRAALEDNPNA